MFFQRIFNPDLAICSYLLGDLKSRQCLVIDPFRLIYPFINIIETHGLKLSHILETHVHADFISGSKELKFHYLGRPIICCSALGGAEWTPTYTDQFVTEGTEIQVGPLKLQARHTPGHTPEHILWLCYDESRCGKTPWFMFTGDLLFIGGVGRPDLLGKNQFSSMAHELYKSLFQRLATLPEFLEIFPAHGAGSLCGKNINARATSTLGYERLCNAALIEKSESEWIQELLTDMPVPPRAFKQIKQINVQGPSIMKQSFKPPLPLGPSEVYSQPLPWIVDVRDPEAFAASHLKGSINIPLNYAPNITSSARMGSAFCTWSSSIIPFDSPLIYVVAEPELAEMVAPLWWLIGLENILGYVIWNEFSLHPSVEKESFSWISPEKLAQEIQQKTEHPLSVIDVRSPLEWRSGHIENAIHIELAQLLDALPQIPPSPSPIACICGSGQRSSIAASLLQKEGFHPIVNVKGGMQAWNRANLPISTDL